MPDTGISDIRVKNPKAYRDTYLGQDATPEKPKKPRNALDRLRMKKLHGKLLRWYEHERERQAANRYQMAIDEDYYDNLQYTEEEIQELHDRGQAATVYNELAATLDWIIGTEKRTRVDFRVLPREEDDVKAAAAKTKVLKFLSDVNRTPFNRSQAFGEAMKAGMGWLEDGVCGDPTEEPIFSRQESWRHMIHDSMNGRDPKDWRYCYRWKWVDLDIAIAMFPHRRQQLEEAAIAADLWGNEEDEDLWYLGQRYTTKDDTGGMVGRRHFLSDTNVTDNRRPRVKIIEGWYREPRTQHLLSGEIFDGHEYDPKNPTMVQAVKAGACSLYDRLHMEVRYALFTERDMLHEAKSPYRHNRFPFTPIWAYRRGRDGMPYGPARRIRDVQDDLNKRASKALFLMSTNRVVTDEDAVEDHDEARMEAARPDAYIVKKKGREFRWENNVELGNEHLMLMERNGRMIRQVGGVTDDNLGRATNAISGEAIKARQLQGSVVTAELFDNLRWSIQHQGEILLSLAEQYMSEPRVIRLTGAKGKIDWVRINQPEQLPDGSIRYLNDITARAADFVVDEQDFSQSMRQAMFESMSELVAKISTINPEGALRLLKMALEFSDLPNKDDMAREIAEMLGEDAEDVDPNDMTPEQRKEWEAKQQAKAQQREIVARKAMQDLDEQAAKIELTRAQAAAAGAQADKSAAEAMKVVQETKLQVEQLLQEFAALSQAVQQVLKPNA